MSRTVQPSAPRESRIAFYLLTALLGISFLGLAIYTVILYLE